MKRSNAIHSPTHAIAMLAMLFVAAPIAATPPLIIPQPAEARSTDGRFAITRQTLVVASGEAAREARKLVDFMAPAMGFHLPLAPTKSSESVIELRLLASLQDKLGGEGYRLSVRSDGVRIQAAQPAGLFYGIQTLRQLLSPAIYRNAPATDTEWILPGVEITDYPRFEWRGLLIDPARHFIPKRDVMRYLDAMALHKFNRLQIHLTDGQGWRIEIKKYPLLTEIGSRWHNTMERRNDQGKIYGGYYTQEDIHELVGHAAERHITLVPEIEMPYHAGAAIVAYPKLGFDPEDLAGLPPEQRRTRAGNLVVPRPYTVAFMKDVLDEIVELFPSVHIHIGGDEAHVESWSKLTEMRERMTALNLADVHELHSWFIKQMDSHLVQHGRRMVGWDEILQGGLAEGATVMSWRGVQGGITAARAGHDVVMAPTSHTYFDYRQSQDKASDPPALGNSVITLAKAYSFEPIPEELNAGQAKHILGGQGQLWGEFIPNERHREFQTYPRACALIETLWSPKELRDFGDFYQRLRHHIQRLDAAGVCYRQLDPRPEIGMAVSDVHAPRVAAALAQRLLGADAERFRFQTIPPDQDHDVFEIETVEGQTVIRGNNGVSMAMGLNWYLKHYCRRHVSWRGSRLDLPNPLPAVAPKLRRVSWAKHRYFLNYCCFGYSLPWFEWDQWERLIDWMALNGVDLPLSVTGEEAVWRAVCQRLGLSSEQVAAFLAGPPYLPFQWMGCLDSWGGPLPANWINRREVLAKKILTRQRALGMTPVLQGFTGHVPAALKEKFPDAKTHTIGWLEWETQLLDPLDPLFADVADVWMQEQLRRLGTDHLYAADTFIEMTPPNGDPQYLRDLSRAIYGGMSRHDPRAVWVLQTWNFSYQQQFWTQLRIEAFLGAVSRGQMLCLDLACEDRPQWSRTRAFFGKPWLWCNIQNYGNTVFLGGALNRIAVDLPAARSDPEAGQLTGLGFVNEGLGYNPVVHDFMYEMAWRDGPVDLGAWIADYAAHRYGESNANAQRAWQTLFHTVYNGTHRTRSIIDRQPTLAANSGRVSYDNARLAKAWEDLLSASDDLGEVDTYRFDLVNVGRQVLVNQAARLHGTLSQAWRGQDSDALEAATYQFLRLIGDVDDLLATREEFLLGRWLADARRWGETDVEKARMEWNARRVLTLWGEGPVIDDYARKDWAGLLRGYYLKRWEMYLSALAQSLRDSRSFDEESFNDHLREWMAAWSDQKSEFPTRPSGDSVKLAKTLFEQYGDSMRNPPAR